MGLRSMVITIASTGQDSTHAPHRVQWLNSMTATSSFMEMAPYGHTPTQASQPVQASFRTLIADNSGSLFRIISTFGFLYPDLSYTNPSSLIAFMNASTTSGPSPSNTLPLPRLGGVKILLTQVGDPLRPIFSFQGSDRRLMPDFRYPESVEMHK